MLLVSWKTGDAVALAFSRSDIAALLLLFLSVVSQDDNRNLRIEVATLRDELSTLESKYQDKYRNALRKNQDVLADIKDNEFRLENEFHGIDPLESTFRF